MLGAVCPNCRKGGKSEVIKGLGHRKHMLRCGYCGTVFIFAVEEDKEKKEKPPP